MREIKFRGYSHYKNGWVYGDLVHDKKVTETGLDDRVKVGGYEVDPDTVRQFTGQKDSEGKEVYEGDTIQIIRHDDNKISYGKVECIFVVKEIETPDEIYENEHHTRTHPADGCEPVR